MWPLLLPDLCCGDFGRGSRGGSLSKLRCHTKKAPTILTSSRTPAQIHQNALHLSDYLTPTEISSGSGKQSKPIGVEKPFTDGGGS